jgi:hypothetical protein
MTAPSEIARDFAGKIVGKLAMEAYPLKPGINQGFVLEELADVIGTVIDACYVTDPSEQERGEGDA